MYNIASLVLGHTNTIFDGNMNLHSRVEYCIFNPKSRIPFNRCAEHRFAGQIPWPCKQMCTKTNTYKKRHGSSFMCHTLNAVNTPRPVKTNEK